VNPDRLRHVAPPCSGSTVAHAQRANTCPQVQMCAAGNQAQVVVPAVVSLEDLGRIL
jgi:hypothetical protein